MTRANHAGTVPVAGAIPHQTVFPNPKSVLNTERIIVPDEIPEKTLFPLPGAGPVCLSLGTVALAACG